MTARMAVVVMCDVCGTQERVQNVSEIQTVLVEKKGWKRLQRHWDRKPYKFDVCQKCQQHAVVGDKVHERYRD